MFNLTLDAQYWADLNKEGEREGDNKLAANYPCSVWPLVVI